MVCGDDVVLATNTSSIPVTSLAGAAARPENVVGMHFFNPPPLMPLLEVIRADQTADRAVELAAERRRGDGQGRDRRGRRSRLPRQPLRPPVLGRGAAAASGARGHARADRPHLPARRRLPHGPVRADGPGGHRRGLRGRQVVHRALLRRAALAPQPDPGAHGRRRPARAKERARLLRLRRGHAPTGRTIPSRPSPVAARARPSRSSGTGRWRTACASAPAPRASSCARAAPPSWWWTPARARTPRRREAPRCSCSARATSLVGRGEQGAVGFHLLPPLEDARLVELTRLPMTQRFAAEAAEEFFSSSASSPSGSRTRPASCSAGSSASS